MPRQSLMLSMSFRAEGFGVCWFQTFPRPPFWQCSAAAPPFQKCAFPESLTPNAPAKRADHDVAKHSQFQANLQRVQLSCSHLESAISPARTARTARSSGRGAPSFHGALKVRCRPADVVLVILVVLDRLRGASCSSSSALARSSLTGRI